MRVQSLQLSHFRNYESLSVTFSPGKNLFLGNNGQGKTNLLEALYFLSHARSHRTTTDRELIRSGSTFGTVSAQLANHYYDGRTQMDAQIKVEDGRLKTVFKANASPLRSRSDVLGYLPTVSFFLPDLLLLRGGPEDRRRWLDAAIVQYDKRHLTYLSEFQKVRLQKNRLLKEPPELISKDHLAAWNLQFAATGAKVIASRLAYLSMIEDAAALVYLELSDARERLGMLYQSAVLEKMGSTLPGSVPEAGMLEALLLSLLEEKMPEELRRGTSLIGPHRDDIRFFLDDMEAEAYGSQGQQRSVVLALKLTELQCMNNKLQEPPVLLLDDVMAELDPDRQRLLVERIHPDSQVFITTTHPTSTWQAMLEVDTREIAVYHVQRGNLKAAEVVA
jgi:DNA replication and repair protein RecF